MIIYIIIGSLLTIVGYLLILIYGNRKIFIVCGIIINAIGLCFFAVGPMIGANKDKAEIIEKIGEFRNEIGTIKKTITNEDSLKKIDKVENEFNQWADYFVRNIEGKKVEQKKANIILNEKEINLSNKWRYVYQCVFETIDNIGEAYNKRAKNKMEIKIPSLPYNLFSKESMLFKGMIFFSNDVVWTIELSIAKPYEEEKVPSINIY